MKVLVYEPSFVPNILKENLSDKNVYFVFPSDVVATSWSEWCVKNSEISGVKAVAVNRFVPWDKFKTNFIESREIGKTAIPSILRKVFVQHIIEQNKKSNKNAKPLFKSIINPEFADNAESFSDWLATNLKSLKTWHKHFEELQKSGAKIDDEDNAITLFEKLSYLSANMIVDTLDDIEEGIARYTPQDESMATRCSMFKQEMGIVDFNKSASEIVGLIKGLAVWPNVRFTINGVYFKLYNAKEYVGEISGNYANGEVVLANNKQGLIIKCKDGFVEITELLPINSKKMTAKSYLNGKQIRVGSIVE